VVSIVDPLGAIADVVLGVYKERKIQQWCKLIFELSFSGTMSALFVCGSTLILSNSWTRSIGAGMIAGVVSSTYLFRQSPLTKGMMLALPSSEADKELATDLQVIEK
jgi:hypothetical protein